MNRKPTAGGVSIILVDDESDILLGSTLILMQAGFNSVETLDDSRNLLPFLADHDASVIVLDLQMPFLSGKVLLEEITSSYPHIPVVIMTAADELETAIDCMKKGAFDYISKPVEPERLIATCRKAIEMSTLRREIASLRESLLTGKLRNQKAFDAIITRSTRMQSLFGYLEAAAVTAQPVLITGETGVGKELIARAVHTLSGATGNFVAINSAGLDDLMFADTLFGHCKGAFTGAADTREGMISRAAGGTLFLDEIGDLSVTSQVKLLRLLQEGEYFPLGSDRGVQSRTRFVVATNQHLEHLIAEGFFRKDLYFRLCSHRVHIPPLRERREDIPLLLEVFLEEASKELHKSKPAYRPELLARLSAYHFPGNVRELKAMIFDALTTHRGGDLTPAAFDKFMADKTSSHGPLSESAAGYSGDFDVLGRFPTLQEMEQYLTDKALQLTRGNQGAAAVMLGLTRHALNKRLCRR